MANMYELILLTTFWSSYQILLGMGQAILFVNVPLMLNQYLISQICGINTIEHLYIRHLGVKLFSALVKTNEDYVI